MKISLKQEQVLLQALRAGKKGAVRQWFNLFSPYLLRITLRRMPSAEDAEEVVQETFINCLKQLLMMKYIDKRKVKDIARSWNTTVKAIESELFRARNEFRALYLQAGD